uniref:Uncharacterized protein n=1 Tax=Timema cristinae TaxID=61476 RepID=A0A7R9HB46_TIMCR|nr:unnamed protein product [Timema cristinae]
MERERVENYLGKTTFSAPNRDPTLISPSSAIFSKDPEPSAVRYSSPVDPSQLLALEGLSPTPAPTPAPRRPQPPYARLQQQLQQTYSDQRTQQQFQTPRRPPPPTSTPASVAYAQLAPTSAHRLHESRLRAALAGDNPNYASEALAQQQLLRTQSTPTPAPEYYQGGDDAVFQQQLTRLVAQAQQEAQLSQQQEAQFSQQQEAQLSRQQEAQLAQQQAVQLSRQQEAQLSRQQEAQLSRQQAVQLSQQQDAQLSQQQEAQLSQQQVAQDEQSQLQQLIQTQSVQPQSFPQPRPQQPTPVQQQQYLSSPPSSAQYQPVYAQQEASAPTGRQVASTTAPIYVPSYPEPQQQQSPPAQYLRETIHPRSRRPQQSVVQIPRQPSRQALTESDPALYQARQPQRAQQQDDDFLSSLLEQPGRGLFNKPSQSTLDIIQSTTALPPSRSSIFVSTTSNLEGRKNSGVTVEEVGSVPQDEGKAIPEVRLPTPQGQRPLTQSEFQALISAGFKVSPIGQETGPPSPVTYTSQEAYESQSPVSVRYQPQPSVPQSYQPQPPALDNYQPQAQVYYQSSPKRQRSYSTPIPPRQNEVIYEQKAPQQQVYQDADYDVPSASPAQLSVPQGQQVQRLSPIVVPDQPEQGEASTQDQPRRRPSGSRRSQYSRSRSSYKPQRPQEVSGENQETYATYDAVPESTNYSARGVRPRGRRPTPAYESS